MKMLKRGEAYIDTVITVLLSVFILYIAVNIFSYFILYNKLSNVTNELLDYCAKTGTTSTSDVEDKYEELLLAEGLSSDDVTISFDGTDYLYDIRNYVQIDHIIKLTATTEHSLGLVANGGPYIFNMSVSSVRNSNKYWKPDVVDALTQKYELTVPSDAELMFGNITIGTGTKGVIVNGDGSKVYTVPEDGVVSGVVNITSADASSIYAVTLSDGTPVSYDSTDNSFSFTMPKGNVSIFAHYNPAVLPYTVNSNGELKYNAGVTGGVLNITSPSLTTINSSSFSNSDKPKITAIILNTPNDINIDYCAFSDFTNLRLVVMNDKVISLSSSDSIGSTFSNCSKLENVILSYGLTKIPPNCFAGCTSLKRINIPPTITEICPLAFSNTGITDITIPATVEHLDYLSFYNTVGGGLKNITILGNNTDITYLPSVNSYLIYTYNPDYISIWWGDNSVHTDVYAPFGSLAYNTVNESGLGLNNESIKYPGLYLHEN